MNIAPVFLSSGEKIRSSYCLRSLVYCSGEPTDVSFLVMDWPQRHRQAGDSALGRIIHHGPRDKNELAARWAVFKASLHQDSLRNSRNAETGGMWVCAILTRAWIASSRKSRKAIISEFS